LVVVGEEELLAVLPRDPPDRREPRRLRIEMRPHGGGEVLGHGSRERLEGWRDGSEASGRELDDDDDFRAQGTLSAHESVRHGYGPIMSAAPDTNEHEWPLIDNLDQVQRSI
jgi:hypothetical protein